MNSTILVLVVLVAIVAAAAVAFSLLTAPSAGAYDSFAQCLTDRGMVMYGAYWCPHCTRQKLAFGESFSRVNYVECDPNGQNANPAACQAAGIQGYPTWIYQGQQYSGEQTLPRLAEITGCQLQHPAAVTE